MQQSRCGRPANGAGGPPRSPREQHSPQETRIAEPAAQGLSNRDIGQRLFLAHRTVGSHLYRIFPKFGITSRDQLAEAMIDHGDRSEPWPSSVT